MVAPTGSITGACNIPFRVVVYLPACESSIYPSVLSGGKKKEESIYKVCLGRKMGIVAFRAVFLGAAALERLEGVLAVFLGIVFFLGTGDRLTCFLAVGIE